MTFYALLVPGVEMSTNGGYGNFSTFGLPATSQYIYRQRRGQ